MHKLASAAVAAISFLAADLSAQVEQRLRQQGIPAIIANAKKRGDARRGAAVFYRPQLTCIQCHVQGDTLGRLGPDLASLGKDVTDTHLIESIFSPSKAIRKGFETTMVSKGEATYTGFLVSESKTEIVIRAAEKNFATVTVKRPTALPSPRTRPSSSSRSPGRKLNT